MKTDLLFYSSALSGFFWHIVIVSLSESTMLPTDKQGVLGALLIIWVTCFCGMLIAEAIKLKYIILRNLQ